MWLWLSIQFGWSETTDNPPSTVEVNLDQAIQSILTPSTKPRTQQHLGGIPCPKPDCQRRNPTQQEAYNQMFFANGNWLAMANTYGQGSQLMPTLEQADDNSVRRFVSWTLSERTLRVVMENQSPQAFFATWSFDAMVPTANPFEPTRLDPLNTTRQQWLGQCENTTVTKRDHRGNAVGWQGGNCNGWSLWLEYDPTLDQALKLMAFKTDPA